MSVPAIGFFLFWLGFVLFITRTRSLLHAAVFLTFFENTAIVIRESPQGSFGLPSWIYFLFLAVVAKAGSSGRKMPGRHQALALGVALFALVSVASLVVPWYINGRYGVPAASLASHGELVPVRLDVANFLIAVPFVAGLTLAVMVWRECTEWRDVQAFLRTVVSAVVVVALLAVWELASLAVGLPYPQAFFRSLQPDRLESTLGYTGLYRLSSVAAEPSLLARVLLVGLCLLVLCRWRNVALLGRSRDLLAILTIVTILLLSASSSALIGLGALIAIGTMVTLLTARTGMVPRLKTLASVSLAVGAAWVAYQQVPVVQSVIAILVTTKSRSDSYLERTTATAYAFHTFTDFPWLGVGLGESSAYDLPAKMLSNVGLIGTLLFALIMWQTARGLWIGNPVVSRTEAGPTRQTISRALLVAIAVQLVVDWITGFYFESAYFWVLCGIGWASFSVPSTDPEEPMTLRPAERRAAS